jgi:hypothetical protein
VDYQPTFLTCPAYLDRNGTVLCGLPAEVVVRYIMNSTDGPLESAKIGCPRGHHFNGPIESLALPRGVGGSQPQTEGEPGDSQLSPRRELPHGR